MYIVFINRHPQDIHTELKHALERKKILEEVLPKDPHHKHEIEIGEVLEWESVEI